MQSTDYKDKEATPDKVANATALAARNAAHLARRACQGALPRGLSSSNARHTHRVGRDVEVCAAFAGGSAVAATSPMPFARPS